MAQQQLDNLTDRELAIFIQELRLQIAIHEGQIENSDLRRQRTAKLVRGTFLTTGGLFTATVEPLALVLTFVGFLDWISAISDDARAWNRYLELERRLREFGEELNAAEVELQRRLGASHVPVIKSGVIDGMQYTLYADGTIEAQLPEGVVRFATIADLRRRIEEGK